MVTMVSSQSPHNFAPSRAPARGRAGVRARVWLPTDHVDHVSALQPCVSKDFAKCMVQNETKCAMLRLRPDRKGRPQLRVRNLFSGLNPRWRRLALVLREELKTVLSCQRGPAAIRPRPGSRRPVAQGQAAAAAPLPAGSHLVVAGRTAPHGRMLFTNIITRGRGATP